MPRDEEFFVFAKPFLICYTIIIILNTMSDSKNFFTIDRKCNDLYPGFGAGILVMEGIDNIQSNEIIQKMKAELEVNIRQQYAGFSREQLGEVSIIKAYNAYYKKFDKTYHVRSQVESIIKGKPMSNISAMLDAMFMAELKNIILTAGHDLDILELPITLSVGDGVETYMQISGSDKKANQNDLLMRDKQGIVSTIINGPDSRTKLTAQTTNALFAVYVPAEIPKEIVENHLKDIQNAILIFSKEAQTKLLEVFVVG